MERTAPSTAPARWIVIVLIGVLSLIWGSTWVVIAKGLETLPPYTSATARFALAALVMAAIAPRVARAEGGARPAAWLSVALGLTSFGSSYAFVYWSETRLPSGVVCVLWSVFPILMALASHFFLAHKLTGARPWLGFGLGFAGVALLCATDLAQFGAHGVPTALVLLLSPLVACVGTTLVKKHGQGTSSALLNRSALAVGAAVLGVLAIAFERDAPAVWNAPAIASVLYLSLVGTVVAFGLYFWLLRHTPAHELSVISYLTPVVGLTLGRIFAGEPLGLGTVGACALVLAGVFLVVHKPRATNANATRVAGRV